MIPKSSTRTWCFSARLVINRANPCVDTYQIEYGVEQRQRLADPTRVVLSVLAGVAVSVPLYALAALLIPSGPDARYTDSSANRRLYSARADLRSPLSHSRQA